MATVLQQVQGVLWMWVALAVGVTLLTGVLRSPRFKGWWGERKVQQWLARDLNPQHYHCVHNITLRLADGNTTQIDHVVVSPYGLFVLETKHMRGWIFGSEKQKEWTQTIYRHRVRFPNPLHQNWGHIKALEHVLQVPLQHLHSVVVFTGHSHFKTEMPARVTQGRNCVAFIQSHTEVVWTAQEVAQWVQALSQKRLQATRATHRAHIENVRARHAA
ncbi:MAG: nuclease-related domain-containing protein, partial [Comamonas sp.]